MNALRIAILSLTFSLLTYNTSALSTEQRHLNKGLIFEEDFEKGKNNTPIGWKTINGEGANFEWSITEKNSGLRSVKIESSSTEGCGWMYQNIPVKSEMEYELSYRMKLDNVESISGGASLSINFYSKKGDKIETKEDPYLKGSKDWSVYVINFAAPPDTQRMELILKMDYAQGITWFDDILIYEKKNTPTFGFRGEFKK